MAGAVDLPKLPEGQESYAGIPKAIFVVGSKLHLESKSGKIEIFYNQQSFPIRMNFLFDFSWLVTFSIVG